MIWIGVLDMDFKPTGFCRGFAWEKPPKPPPNHGAGVSLNVVVEF